MGVAGRPLPEFAALTLERALERDWRDDQHRLRRRRAVAVALCLHGLRTIEVGRLTRRCLCTRHGSLRVQTAKGGRKRLVPLHPDFAAALDVASPTDRRPGGLLLASGRNNPLDDSSWSRYAAWVETLLGERYTMHCLRHTAACRLWAATKDIVAVQRLLGHRTLLQTHVYLQHTLWVEAEGLPTWTAGEGATSLRVVSPAGWWPPQPRNRPA